MWSIKELKTKGKAAFKANYWISVLAAFIITLFTGGAASSAGRNSSNNQEFSNLQDELSNNPSALIILFAILGIILVAALGIAIIKILVGNAFIVGSKKVFIQNETEGSAPATSIISVFKSGSWFNVTLVMFLKNLVIGLFSILLVIPGLIMAYRYRMIDYILAEDPTTTWKEAKAKSIEMMYGNKWKSFVLDLSFIGWYLLSALTLGILAVFYVSPYINQTDAELYLTLKGNEGNKF